MFSPRKTSSGQEGVWVYQIGSSDSFHIAPGTTSDLLEEEEEPETPPGQEAEEQQGLPTLTPGSLATPTAGGHVTAPPSHTFRPRAATWDAGYRANRSGPTRPWPVRSAAQTSRPPQPPAGPTRDPELAEPRYSDPDPARPAQVVVVDEDLDVEGRWAGGGSPGPAGG